MKIEHALGSVRLDPVALSTDTTMMPRVRHLWLRRLAFWVPIAAATVLATALGVVATAGVATPLRWPLLALLGLNVMYMAVTGTPSLIGLVLHLTGRRLQTSAQPSGLSRTAVLMPVHREDPVAVFAAIEVMARSMHEAALENVDIYVLSDTQDAAEGQAEQAAFDALLARAASTPALHYRRRTSNAGRKVGNLADFCERWGDQYDYMVVLDADSLMGASAIARLIGLMDANALAGVIQTVPHPVGRETLFARLQQFSARLYGPLLVEGLTFWQQSDGNYWGHNAIVRIAPFRAHCGLPRLPGREPFGGEILCHDVVEAGLMRGAGWDVWVLPEALESYEAVPANMVDFAVRERRWCQGNLQHAGLLRMAGLRPVGRFHLGYGVAHYLAAPAAVLFLALASIDAVLGGGFARALLHGPAGGGLVAVGAFLLYAGKVASLGVALADRAESRRFGGRAALLAGAVLEQLAAFVISAVLIVAYTRYVVDLFRGRSVRWDVQPRDDRGVGWAEAWLRVGPAVIVGSVWLLLLPMMPWSVGAWTLPLLLGLLAAWPMTVFSSRMTLGSAARRLGLLLTPEEVSPSAVVRAFQRAIPTPVQPEREAPMVGALHLAPAVGKGH